MKSLYGVLLSVNAESALRCSTKEHVSPTWHDMQPRPESEHTETEGERERRERGGKLSHNINVADYNECEEEERNS